MIYGTKPAYFFNSINWGNDLNAMLGGSRASAYGTDPIAAISQAMCEGPECFDIEAARAQANQLATLQANRPYGALYETSQTPDWGNTDADRRRREAANHGGLSPADYREVGLLESLQDQVKSFFSIDVDSIIKRGGLVLLAVLVIAVGVYGFVK